MNTKTLLLIFLFTPVAYGIRGQQTDRLYADSIPGSLVKPPLRDQPTLTIFTPQKEKVTGAAILVIPGGAYAFLAMQEEGLDIGRAFADRGITAFVLKYRLPNDATMRDKSFGPLTDAQQAIKYVREHAAEFHIDSTKVGVIGFSAGGHLAATLGTHYDTCLVDNPNHTNLRPDFMILVYPVISMDEQLTHPGSRISLLGEKPAAATVNYFSSEKQVRADTPPTYITHTGDDAVVSVYNSMVFYNSLLQHKVDAELHLYPKGDHGFIQRLPINEWLDPMLLFLKKQGFLH